MERRKSLLELARAVRDKRKIYLMQGRIEEVYALLLGWDAANGTDKGREYIHYVGEIKRTGNRVPSFKDVDIEEALDMLIDMEVRSIIE